MSGVHERHGAEVAERAVPQLDAGGIDRCAARGLAVVEARPDRLVAKPAYGRAAAAVEALVRRQVELRGTECLAGQHAHRDHAASFRREVETRKIYVRRGAHLHQREELVACIAAAQGIGRRRSGVTNDAARGIRERVGAAGAVEAQANRDPEQRKVARHALLRNLFLRRGQTHAAGPPGRELSAEGGSSLDRGLVVGFEVLFQRAELELERLVPPPEVRLDELPGQVVADIRRSGAAQVDHGSGKVELLGVPKEVAVRPARAHAGAEVRGVGRRQAEHAAGSLLHVEGQRKAPRSVELLVQPRRDAGEDSNREQVLPRALDAAGVELVAGAYEDPIAHERFVDGTQSSDANLAEVYARSRVDLEGEIEDLPRRVFLGDRRVDARERTALLQQRAEQPVAAGQDVLSHGGRAGRNSEPLAHAFRQVAFNLHTSYPV